MEVVAFMNHGRWVAQCPNCNGAELVAEGEPFICGSEWPGAFEPVAGERERWKRLAISQGKAHVVTWPADKAAIEAAVSARPEANRNWEPGERVEDLLRENEERLGVEAQGRAPA